MLPGGYSYRALSDHHVNQLKEKYQGERSQMLARARKVQLETNKRRRTLALKKKQEAQKEEKRRQEILARRKEQIREATERFQRANTHYQPFYNFTYEKEVQGESHTEDGVRQEHQATPALEDALKLVRGSPGLRRSFSYDGATSKFPSQADSTKSHNPYNNNTSASNASQNERIQEHARQVAARTELHNRSLNNLTNSRSLFEQQLEQHQSQLIEKHKASLHEFTSAVQEELHNGSDRTDRKRSGSISSEDSLEADQGLLSHLDSNYRYQIQANSNYQYKNHSNYQQNKADSNYQVRNQQNENMPSSNPYTPSYQHMPTYSHTSTNQELYSNSQNKISHSPNSFILHRSSSSPSNVAVVQPNNAQSSPDAAMDIKKDYASNAPPYGVKPVTNDPEFLKSYYNTIHYSSPTTDTFLYNAQISSNNVYNQQYTPDEKNDPGKPCGSNMTHDDKTTPKEIVQTRLKAWATPSPVDSNQSQGSQMKSKADNPMVTNAGQNGAKPTSTYTTVTTASNSVSQTRPVSTSVAHNGTYTSGKTDIAKSRVTEANNSRYLSGSYYSVKSYADQGRPSGTVNKPAHRYIISNKPELVLDDEGSVEDDTEEIENKEPVKEVKNPSVKSILRKRPSSADRFNVKGLGYSASLAKQRHNQQAVNSGAVTASINVKDSLEVARQHINSRQDNEKPKKSVRFADNLEEHQDSSEENHQEAEDSEGEKKIFIPSPPTSQKPVAQRPPRAVSARVSGSQSAMRSVKARAESAGPARTGIPLPTRREQVSKPQPAHAAPTQSLSRQMDTKTQVMYDNKGLRLDRTPTDDEINVLWDRVRDCLSRASSAGDAGSVDARSQPHSSAQLSQKNTEGSNFTQQSTVNINNNGFTRKKVTMEHLTSYSARQASALHRQQQQNRLGIGGNSAVNGQVSAMSIAPYHTSTAYTPSNGFNKEVTDSLAAFMTAEAMSKRAASESQIGNAIDAIQQRQPTVSVGRPQLKGHSALSIEEQRLLQSLEKLNERLKMTEQTLNPTNVYMPRPPAQPPGFRGAQQTTHNQRRYSATMGTGHRQNFR